MCAGVRHPPCIQPRDRSITQGSFVRSQSSRFIRPTPPPASRPPRPLGHPGAADHGLLHRGRAITVALAPEHLVVTTDQADDITDALARGFARASAYAFGTDGVARLEGWW
jgi:hypothetical protein